MDWWGQQREIGAGAYRNMTGQQLSLVLGIAQIWPETENATPPQSNATDPCS